MTAFDRAFERAQYRYDHMEPPDDTGRDAAFESWCEDNDREGTDADSEEFDDWVQQEITEAAIDAAADRIENRNYYMEDHR